MVAATKRQDDQLAARTNNRSVRSCRDGRWRMAVDGEVRGR